MDLSDLITPYGVIPSLKAANKKQVLQILSDRAADLTGLNSVDIYNILFQRERLGSTGVGSGIAIPHGKLQNLRHSVGVFARLEEPVEFESIDEEPVDIVMLLLAPESAGADHLKALARVSRLLREPKAVEKLARLPRPRRDLCDTHRKGRVARGLARNSKARQKAGSFYRSVKRHKLQIALFHILKRRRPAVGQHHRRAIRGNDGIEIDALRQAAKLRKHLGHVLRLKLFDIGKLAFAPGFQFKIFEGFFHGKHLLVPNAHPGMPVFHRSQAIGGRVRCGRTIQHIWNR